MIEAVEVEEGYTAEVLAFDEAVRWKELKESLRQVMNQLDDARIDSIRETRDKLTPEYDKLEAMLDVVYDYVDGRIEELVPGSYRDDMELHYYADKEEVEVLDYAFQERINAVALWKIYPVLRRLDVIDYILEHGLASMNYESTCLAVREYERVDFKMRTGYELPQEVGYLR